ncbi:MAG: P-loop containing nucleoside triphosphate hydrolase protein [Monoraphidium minutum]|nr:MAG: P-loop containing nucleoside triphosphate hydrolase protein [Monoraphidium minutum]
MRAQRPVLPTLLQLARSYARGPRLPKLRKAPESEEDALLPTVALVGRPNVGKSALFNRLLRKKEALVYDTPDGHVTRDYKEGVAQLGDLRFRAIDTSGLEPLAAAGSLQARAAALTLGVLRRCDAALVLFDAREGVVPGDQQLARWLRRALPPGAPPQLLLVANKAETRQAQQAEWTADAQTLGLGEPVAVSATAGEGLADLYTLLRPAVDEAAEELRAQQGGGGGGAEAAAGGGAAGEGKARAGGGGGGGGGAEGAARPGWHAAHHLNSAELAQLAAIREAEGAAAGDEDEGGDGGDLGLGGDDDLGEITVAEDGSIVAGGGGGGGGSGGGGGGGGERMPEGPLRLAIVGAPNAGKSTLLNSLLGWDRALTGPEPGLTRDATREWSEWRGLEVELADTAGWARKAVALAQHDDVGGAVAALTQAQARRALGAAHVAVLLIDAPALAAARADAHLSAAASAARGGLPLPRRDLDVATSALREGKALIVALSKADLLPGGGAEARELAGAVVAALARRCAEAGEPPVVVTSAVAGAGREELLDAAVDAYIRWNRRVPTARLLRALRKHAARLSGSPAGALLGRVKWACQLRARPPAFAFFLRGGSEVAQPEERFLANLVRRVFDLQGVPLRMHIRYNKREEETKPGQRRRRKRAAEKGRQPHRQQQARVRGGASDAEGEEIDGEEGGGGGGRRVISGDRFSGNVQRGEVDANSGGRGSGGCAGGGGSEGGGGTAGMGEEARQRRRLERLLKKGSR